MAVILFHGLPVTVCVHAGDLAHPRRQITDTVEEQCFSHELLLCYDQGTFVIPADTFEPLCEFFYGDALQSCESDLLTKFFCVLPCAV